MEWISLSGSITSSISVLLVVLSLAIRRKAVNDRTFRALISLLVTLVLIGIGVIVMIFAQETRVQGIGVFMIIAGIILLFIIVISTLRIEL